MISARQVLLVGDADLAGEFTARMTGSELTVRDDPYDALAEMGRRAWSSVVVTAPRAELESLCRASRRLLPSSPLYVVCSPAAEPEVRLLRPVLLDDYFIYPPTGREWARLRGEGDPSRRVANALRGSELAELISALHTPQSLEDCLAGLVARRLQTSVRWVEAGPAAPQGLSLLRMDPGEPKVLVGGERMQVRPADQALLDDLQGCLPALVEAARRMESLHHLAITDHLTGAYNRRYFYHLTEQILRRAAERQFHVTLLLYDIDDFKRYNDTYGHAAGDEILRETAQLMKRITRSHDIVARIGGDEFAVLFWDAEKPRLPNSHHPESAYALADRFRQAVSRHEFASLGPEARGALTISGGLAAFPWDGANCRDLLRRADQALREGKARGKNVIHLIGPDDPLQD